MFSKASWPAGKSNCKNIRGTKIKIIVAVAFAVVVVVVVVVGDHQHHRLSN